MSLYDYHVSFELQGAPFYALIMAAMRRADDDNLMRLRIAFPEVFMELTQRYNSRGGILESERPQVKDNDGTLTIPSL